MKGIYCIINIKNNKRYIGSSIDIEQRFKQHLYSLSKNKHYNKHLQLSFNKYGENNFIFEIMETFDEIERYLLFDIEKEYLLKYNFKNLYNLTTETKNGGWEVSCKKCFILDLNGNIIESFNSIADASIFFKLKGRIPAISINSSSIIRHKYRLVTKDFYENELELILSWRNYKNLENSFNKYYKYDNISNKYIVFHNNEIIAKLKEEKDAIKISKYLLKIDNN